MSPRRTYLVEVEAGLAKPTLKASLGLTTLMIITTSQGPRASMESRDKMVHQAKMEPGTR